jgi:hypothetical protein
VSEREAREFRGLTGIIGVLLSKLGDVVRARPTSAEATMTLLVKAALLAVILDLIAGEAKGTYAAGEITRWT